MIDNLPMYINIVFILTTLLTVVFFYAASNRSVTSLIIISCWLLIQGVLALTRFYEVTDTTPPRFPMIAVPALIFIAFLFISSSGRKFLDGLNNSRLTILHIVRVPVEICLYWLFINKTIPELMTFEGRNFDIIAGLTAPIIYYFGFVKKILGNITLLLWNFICLALLLNIVVNAILSLPSPVQQFAFEQPNTAILYFPFIWLPALVVPLVLLAHLASIRKLILKK